MRNMSNQKQIKNVMRRLCAYRISVAYLWKTGWEWDDRTRMWIRRKQAKI